ncbi:oxidoreductase [Streptomonospora sediminis]
MTPPHQSADRFPDSPDRTVLVSGASSGIGRECARLFARRGFRVFGTSRSPRPDADGVEMLRLDVASEESVAACVAAAAERSGGIGVLVNNAADVHHGIAEETPPADAAAVFETNLFGAARLANAVLPQMRARGRGRIVNVGSLAAWVGEPGEGYYAASKAALARYTEALHHEVKHCGVDVCLVEPGAFATGTVAAATRSPARISDYDGVRERAQQTMDEAMRKGGDPGAAAARIVAAATDRSPRLRYGAGAEARWLPLLQVLLPQRLSERLLRRGFRLPG